MDSELCLVLPQTQLLWQKAICFHAEKGDLRHQGEHFPSGREQLTKGKKQDYQISSDNSKGTVTKF
jgi:hypothetical protein